MWFKKPRVYLDTASATPVLDTAVGAVTRANALFGNPGSIHQDGVLALASLENSRKDIAIELACKPREVVFVSGGTDVGYLVVVEIDDQPRPLVLADVIEAVVAADRAAKPR